MNSILNQPDRLRVSTDRLNRVHSQLVEALKVTPALSPPEKTQHSYSNNKFSRTRAGDDVDIIVVLAYNYLSNHATANGASINIILGI